MNYPDTFAQWSEDDNDGHAHLEAAIEPTYPGDEPGENPSQCIPLDISEFMARAGQKLHPKTSPKGRAIDILKKATGASLLFAKNCCGLFKDKSLRVLAKEYHLTPAFLYRLNAQIYGQGFNVLPRSERGREHMRQARLRKKADAANVGPKKEGAIEHPIEGASIQKGGVL